MLECQRGDDRSILRIGLGSAPNLGAAYENLSDAAVVKPTDAACVNLRIRTCRANAIVGSPAVDGVRRRSFGGL